MITATAVIYLSNASWLAPPPGLSREYLAHRGLFQTFDPWGIDILNGCTASKIDTPRHSYIENTLPAFQAALDLGADIIEFDVHPTSDGEIVVFHDWSLDCRTNGKGVVREQTLAYLQSLDLGYGYTADNGSTYPFRGQPVGTMPTLDQVLKAFPGTQFLINLKGSQTDEAEQLSEYLKKDQRYKRKRISVLGSGAGILRFQALNPDLVTLSYGAAKSCLKTYVLFGWSSYVPRSCHNTLVPVPENYQWLIWGWPQRFEQRMAEVGSRALLMGPHHKNKANSGIDNLDSLRNIPKAFTGIVFTNRIDLVDENQR